MLLFVFKNERLHFIILAVVFIFCNLVALK